MKTSMGTNRQALIVVPLIIGSLCCAFGVLGYLLQSVLGIPDRFHMPVALRAAGVAVLALGFTIMGWLFKYRSPFEILTSTYITMRKSIDIRKAGGIRKAGETTLPEESARMTPPGEQASRTEPLILEGPQRHVRHPMYFAVVALILGWWLLFDYTFILFMAVFFFFWFTLVVIRFEEAELRAIFGEQYEAYARAVPKFLPSLKPRWP
jgi:hypothetical protein